jgi:ubiquinone/menaquinone biosynthesis C-methylase UbiE
MANCFEEKYAQYYDLIYKNKNYKKECDYLEKIFRKFLNKKPKTILDLACGTGSHAIILAKR